MQDLSSGTGILAVIGWLFFHSLWVSLLLAPLLYFYCRERQQTRQQRSQLERRRQCKDAFIILASAVSAGYSLENAVFQSEEELFRLWGEDSYIGREWKHMEQQLKAFHLPVEQLFTEFARRSGVEEAVQLAQLLEIAKRSGGNTANILHISSAQLNEALQAEEEIQTGITQVKYEQRIMALMPPAILMYLQVGAMDMIKPIYETIVGRISMIFALILYGVAIVWGKRISNILV